MKWFKILAATAILFSSVAFAAQQIDTSGLSDEQVAALKISALQMQQKPKEAAAIPVAAQIRGEAEKWADFGKNVGSALVSTAKELGVAANDFAKTDLGRISIAIIVMKLVGAQIIHFIVGFALLFLLPYLIIRGRNYAMTGSIEYEWKDRKFGPFEWRKREITKVEHVHSGDAFWISFWTTAFILLSIVGSVILMVL